MKVVRHREKKIIEVHSDTKSKGHNRGLKQEIQQKGLCSLIHCLPRRLLGFCCLFQPTAFSKSILEDLQGHIMPCKILGKQ